MKNKSLKVLAIGNSFSMDAMHYLWQLAHDYGFEEIILGDLYIAGCSLETHWNNASGNLPNYDFYMNTSGKWDIIKQVSILDALKKEKWDIITMQQSSGKSGLGGSFQPFLQNLVDYVKQHKINEFKLAWHMTWAYQRTHLIPAFGEYQYDQMVMYQSILNNVHQFILKNPKFTLVIPCGTAIQNARTSIIGDQLTRDGYHLTIGLGRYIVGLMWLISITNESITDITYVPEELTDLEVKIAKAAVELAYNNPYQVSSLIKKDGHIF